MERTSKICPLSLITGPQRLCYKERCPFWFNGGVTWCRLAEVLGMLIAKGPPAK